MISIVLLLPFFKNLYCMHCMYNVVVVIVVVEINFNSKKIMVCCTIHYFRLLCTDGR